MFNLSIRRALVISGLFVGAATLLATPTKVMAGTTGTVNVGGTVTSTLNMTTTPDANAGVLPLDGGAAGVTQMKPVATMAIDTNNEQGYTLTATPAGALTKAGGTDIAYGVAVTTGTAQASDFAADGQVKTYSTGAANAPGTGGVILSIKYTPASLQDPGNYTSSITLNVADNQ